MKVLELFAGTRSISIHSAIDKAVIDTILGFVEVAKRGADNG